jgi:hypothetical protein
MAASQRDCSLFSMVASPRHVIQAVSGRDTYGSDLLACPQLPITKIPGTNIPSPVPISNLGRVYFKFGQPIDTRALDVKDAAACSEVYAECKRRVEGEIADLLEIRETDPRRAGWARLTGDLMGSLGFVSSQYSPQEMDPVRAK